VIPLPFVFFGNLEFSLPIALGKAPIACGAAELDHAARQRFIFRRGWQDETRAPRRNPARRASDYFITVHEARGTKFFGASSTLGSTASLCTLKRRSWIGDDFTKSS
jgi:hypothetical protein